MKKRITFLFWIVFFTCCSLDLYSQDDLIIKGKLGGVTQTFGMMEEINGQLVPKGDLTTRGNLELTIILYGKVYLKKLVYNTSDNYNYECGKNMQFIIKDGVIIPSIAYVKKLPYENLSQAIEAFINKESSEDAWAMWVLQSAGDSTNEKEETDDDKAGESEIENINK